MLRAVSTSSRLCGIGPNTSKRLCSPLPLRITSRRTGFASSSTTVSTQPPLKSKTISLWYPVVGGLVITVAGGLKYFHDHFGGTEGLWRSASFYSYAIPKYVQYRWHTFKGSPDHVWDELDQETSKGALEKILELEGFYIKWQRPILATPFRPSGRIP
jgi:hypothetical protein